ncbi:MAG: hypothetical protein U0694_01095 [Anaerolineae bacterium]
MQPREIFEIWAPETSVWSAWAKPVIFAQMKEKGVMVPPDSGVDYEAYWAPNTADRTALIVNLPGDESVRAGLSLVERGYRPVPLYNTSLGVKPVLDLNPIITKLVAGAGMLQGAYLDEQAPPAFLLDSDRLKGLLPPQPGMYDNRWVVWPQDFPSSTFLRSKDIQRVMVVQSGTRVQDDLAHVLARWQRDKLEVVVQDVPSVNAFEKPKPGDLAAEPAAMRYSGQIVPFQPSGFFTFWMWTRMMMPARFGLRRSSVGGFGGIVPFPSSGGS